MLIANNVAGNTLSGGKYVANIERDISGLYFELAVPAASAIAIADASVHLRSLTMDAYVVSKKAGQVQIANQTPLSVIAEYGQNAEGFIRIVDNGTNITGLRFFLPLCPEGALSMQDDETISIAISGVPNSADYKLNIWGIETSTADFSVHQFSEKAVPEGNTEKEFDLTDVHTLIVPNVGNVTEVVITYSNGKWCRYTNQEMNAISDMSNDLAYIATTPAGTAYGAKGNHVLTVASAVSCVIKTDGTAVRTYVVRDRAATKTMDVEKINSKLEDTTGNALLKDAAVVNSK